MTNKELLKKLHADAKNAYNSMVDAAKVARDENRVLNAEESAAFDKFDKEYKGIEASISRTQKLIEIENRQNAEKADDIENPAPKANELPTDKKELDHIYAVSFWKALAKQEMTPLERKAFNHVNKAQSTTNAAGGYTIPTGFSNQLEVAMKYFGPMLEAGLVFDPGTGGNDYQWPTLNDTSNTGKLLAEAGNSTTSANDLTFAQITLGAYKFSSDLIAYSAEIDADSYFMFDSVIAEALGERLGRVQNTYFTTGTGSSQPQGVVVGASTGVTAAGAAAITRGDIVNLIHSVDPSYRQGPNVGLMFNDSTLSAIRKLSFGSADDRPLWTAGDMQSGIPATIEGFRYWVNNDMASIATAAISALFGDFSKFKIRQAGGVRVKRSEDIYIATDQSAIVGFSRYDSKVIDGGGGAIKKLTQA